MHGWSPRVMRSNSGHSIVEAKMLDFQVLVFVTSFCFSPPAAKLACCCKYSKFARVTHQRSGETEACNSIAAWVREPVTGNSSISDCDFAERTQWTSSGMSTAIQFTHTISKNSHFSGRPWNGFVQSGAIPTQNLKSFWSLCESSNFWTSVTIFVACARGLNVAVAHSINTGVRVLVFHPYGIILQIYCFWAQIEAQRPTFNSKMALTKISACGAAVLYIRNLIMLERMVDSAR